MSMRSNRLEREAKSETFEQRNSKERRGLKLSELRKRKRSETKREI
jgi:hypothetical protein